MSDQRDTETDWTSTLLGLAAITTVVLAALWLLGVDIPWRTMGHWALRVGFLLVIGLGIRAVLNARTRERVEVEEETRAEVRARDAAPPH